MLGDFWLILEQIVFPKSLLQAHVWRFLVNFGAFFSFKIVVACACLAIFLLILAQLLPRKSLLQAHAERFFVNYGAILGLKIADAGAL